MFSYSKGYYVSPPDDQYLKFKNRCSLVYTVEHIHFNSREEKAAKEIAEERRHGKQLNKITE